MDIGILIAVLGLLVAILSAVGEKRPLAWAVVVITLIIPNAILTWGAIQISARLLAPTATDVSSFVIQIAWAVGAFSALYPLIWGIKFYPSLKSWVSNIPSTPRRK